MSRNTCLILAASLIFPLLAFSAAQPEQAPAAPSEEAETPIAGDPGNRANAVLLELLLRFAIAEAKGSGMVEMPEAFHDLAPDQQQYVREALADQLRVERDLEELNRDRQRGLCLAGRSSGSLCEFGESVARMEPCLAAGDCPAVEAWKQTVGEMGIVPAPQTMTSVSSRSAPSVERPGDERP